MTSIPPSDDSASSNSLSTRSRSNSESQFKSTRAEKRMGRLFRQNGSSSTATSTTSIPKQSSSVLTPSASYSSQAPNSSHIPINASSTSISSTSGTISSSQQQQPLQQKSEKQLDFDELKFHVGRSTARSMSQSTGSASGTGAPGSMPPKLPESSLMSSSTSPGPSSGTNVTNNNVSNTTHSASSSIASTSSLSATSQVSIPGRKSSLSQQTMPGSFPFQFKPPIQQYQEDSSNNNSGTNSNSSSTNSSKLTTLKESPTPTATPTVLDYSFSDGDLSIDLSTILKLATKFKFIYSEFLLILRKLGLSINISTTSFNNFTSFFENADKKSNDEDKENVNEYLRMHLLSLMIECMTDLKRVTDHLNFSAQLPSSCNSESVRMSYFSMFSIFMEMVTMCKIIEPEFNASSQEVVTQQQQLPQKPTSLPTSTATSTLGLPSRSQSQLQLNQAALLTQKSRVQPTPKINRAPAPNPHQPAQSAIRQPSLSATATIQRQPLKIDTNLNVISRQDSEMSVSSVGSETPVYPNGATDDEKMFDMINYTTQAAQVVFTQLNNAISKSAIASAQSSSTSSSASENESLITDSQQPDDVTKIAQKVKELTTHCVTSMEQTKRIRVVLSTARSMANMDEECQRKLYEETNLFLKSIINILAATKGAIHDMPALNEVRGALSNLTRATKELTLRLEASSLKYLVTVNSTNTLVEQPPLSSIPSMANFQNTGPPLTSTTQHFFPPESVSNANNSNNYPASSSSPVVPTTSSLAMNPPIAPAQSSNAVLQTTNTNNSVMPPTSSTTSASLSSSPTTTAISNSTFSLSTAPSFNVPKPPIPDSEPKDKDMQSIQQHIKNLQFLGSTGGADNGIHNNNVVQPIPVTTPLVASIGTAAASAVLPITSPLNSSSGTPTHSNSNSNSNALNSANDQSNCPTNENNPFDKMIFHNSLLSGATSSPGLNHGQNNS